MIELENFTNFSFKCWIGASSFVIWQSHATLSDEATNVSFLNWQSIDRYVILTLSAVASSFFNAAI